MKLKYSNFHAVAAIAFATTFIVSLFTTGTCGQVFNYFCGISAVVLLIVIVKDFVDTNTYKFQNKWPDEW